MGLLNLWAGLRPRYRFAASGCIFVIAGVFLWFHVLVWPIWLLGIAMFVLSFPSDAEKKGLDW